ncbi:DNA polymerase beta-like protein [Phyllosticta capitalensis]
MDDKNSLQRKQRLFAAIYALDQDEEEPDEPHEDCIFKDLVFFFFPNDDTHAARRMRITKSVEHGATWVVEWCSYVTHVIVDKNFEYESMRRYLNKNSFPGNAQVVCQDWTSDCFAYKALVDPDLPQYNVLGYSNPNAKPKHMDAAEEQPSNFQSPQSLQLKPPKHSENTPSQAEECSADSNKDTIDVRAILRDSRGNEQPTVAPLDPEEHNHPKSDDPLDQLIAEAKKTEHLPLDSEDEESSAQQSAEEDSDSEGQPPKKMSKKSISKETWQCMKKNDGKGDGRNPNARTIEILTEMGHYYDRVGDEWRTRAYRRAVSTLRKQDERIMTKEEAFELPFIGQRLATKIEEIVWTNRLRRLDATIADPMDAALRTFMGVYGVGLSQASKWVMKGFKTLEDLKGVPLTPAQQVGIDHYEDLNTRIPRDEVTRHAAVVTAAIQKLDKDFTVTVGGSYRRGASSCGDIDMLISHPNASQAYLQEMTLNRLVPQLTKAGYLKVALASAANYENGSKWHGTCALPASECGTRSYDAAPSELASAEVTESETVDGPWRRIDLLLVPHYELGAALIYFTGNDIFNRSIRLLASRKHMRLNQRGLYKNVMRARDRTKVTEGELVEGADEKKIFEILGVPWRKPEHRIC